MNQLIIKMAKSKEEKTNEKRFSQAEQCRHIN